MITMATIYDFSEKEMGGKDINFADYKGKVLLIVNTASKCGLAPQLEGIETLYERYHDKGLEVIGLPSNQFHQEYSDEQETNDFCQIHYGVTFPMTTKILVNGKGEDPLFTYLKDTAGHGRIKWNFTKFLIAKDGSMIDRYAPLTNPKAIEPDIIAALKA
jgi:glutathione peroxidase